MSSSALDAAEAAILSLADIAGNTVLALSRGPAEAERVKELSREYLGKVEAIQSLLAEETRPGARGEEAGNAAASVDGRRGGAGAGEAAAPGAAAAKAPFPAAPR